MSEFENYDPAKEKARLRKEAMAEAEKIFNLRLEAMEEVLRAFFDGEVYGYVVQTRDEGGEWADTDDSCWGLIGREHAENSAREAFLVMKIRASRGELTSATGLR